MGTVYRHLYDQVCDWENLMRAWRKACKGKRGRPTADDARTDVEPPPLRSAPPVGVSPVTRMARRAVRRVVRTGAWALTSAITAPAARLDQGDSLLVIARKA